MDIWVGLSFSPMLSPLQLDWRGLRTRRGWPCTTQHRSTTRRMFLSKAAGLSTWRTCTLRPRRDSRYNSKKVRHWTREDSVIDELFITCGVFFVVYRKQDWTEFPWWWQCCCKLYGNDLSFFIIASLRSQVSMALKPPVCACMCVSLTVWRYSTSGARYQLNGRSLLSGVKVHHWEYWYSNRLRQACAHPPR